MGEQAYPVWPCNYCDALQCDGETERCARGCRPPVGGHCDRFGIDRDDDTTPVYAGAGAYDE
jgi:hypothetical protein